MVVDALLIVVNHYAWIEHDGFYAPGRVRVYVKWGHYPEVDGKIDPSVITRLSVVGPRGISGRAVVGVDRDSSAKQSVFLEFMAEEPGPYLVLLEYSKGVYTVTSSGSWVYGSRSIVEGLGYSARYSLLLRGLAKSYVFVGHAGEAEGKPITRLLEVTPLHVKPFGLGDRVRVLVTYDGKPLPRARLRVMDGGESLVETDEGGEAEISIRSAKVVVMASYEAREEGKDYDYVRFSTTLTLVASRG